MRKAPFNAHRAARPPAVTTLPALAAAVLLAASPVGGAELDRLTISQELKVGQIFAQAVEQRYPVLRDPVLEWYLNWRGRQLADLSDRSDVPYFFGIIDTPEINAFAIPGGHIYIHLGVFQVAEDEGELLGIVAHEIGHTVGRHGAEQILRRQWLDIALSAAVGRHADYYTYLAANLFGELGFLKMSRDAEREADDVGFEVLRQAGYHPDSMVGMFQKLMKRHDRNPNLLEKLFSTHPPTQARIEALEERTASAELPSELIRTSGPFEEVKARVERLYPAPEPEEEGEEQEDSEETRQEGERSSPSDDEEEAETKQGKKEGGEG